jgi:serine protease Do
MGKSVLVVLHLVWVQRYCEVRPNSIISRTNPLYFIETQAWQMSKREKIPQPKNASALRWVRSVSFATSLAAAMGQVAVAQSQPFARGSVPITIQRVDDPSHSQRSRDEQYSQIAQEVDLIERQHSLLRRVVKLVAPTVVHIEAVKDEPVSERNSAASRTDLRSGKQETRKIEEAGSGVIVQIGNANFVITNRHVIHAAALQNLKLETSEGVPLKPVRVWEDPSTDIAVIDIGRNNLPFARLADSRLIEMGDYVFAVGSPFGLNHSVSYGIISAKGRRNLELGSKAIVYQDFIQTDAAINPGNSGGPLMNLRGEVIGINTAIASNSGGNEGIGFSIPINVAMLVAKQLVEKGELQRSYLGVSVERAFNVDSNVANGDARPRGAFVKVIKPNSPAEIAGLRYGDVILLFDGTPVENDEHLVQLVGLTAMDRPIDVIIQRESKQVRISVDLVPIPSVH